MTHARQLSPLLFVLPLLLCGCRAHTASHEASSTPVRPTPTAAAVDPATASTITGVVLLKGTPPARIPIDMSMDPACSLAGENLTEQYVVREGKLANVYLYIKSGLPASSAPVGAPVIHIDQHGCRFVPHVAAVQGGAQVEFTNSDPTMHNVHTVTVGGNDGIDVSQGPGAPPQVRRFPTPGTMLRIGCNNHPWMNAALNVAPNPFFAVTGAEGTFSISGLPPGTYTLAAVHEKLGEQDVQITVPPHGTAKTTVSFALL